jgi:arylsulfatase A-like enzyme
MKYLPVLIAALGFLLVASVSQADAPALPNIVVFLVDDMGPMDTSVPFVTDAEGKPERYPLNDFYRTPSMERLAAQGTRLSQFYAMSSCSPTRTSLITGQNATRHGVTAWIRAESNNGGTFGPPDWNWTGFDTPGVTLPAVLNAHGYRTVFIGKAHFGPLKHPTEKPDVYGYDVNIAGCAWGQPGSYYGQDGFGHLKGNKQRAVPDLEKYHGKDIFLTEALTLEAKREIDAAVDAGESLFLHFCPYAVHAPFQPNPRYAANYADSDKPKKAQAFATLIESMDTALGELMDHLEERGIAENTLIVFLGDNGSDAPLGATHGHASSAPYRGKKATHYEGGMLTPFIAAWAKPDTTNPWQRKLPIAQGTINTRVAAVMDIYPTLLGLVGADVPEGHTVDGHDLAHQLTGEPSGRPQRFLMHFPHQHRSPYFTTLRLDDWKLAYHYNPETPTKPTVELYNLKEDPFETNDLAAAEPAEVARLVHEMAEQLGAEGALYPVDAEGKELKPNVPATTNIDG